MMTPRIRLAALALLGDGKRLTKYGLGFDVHCDQRTAQRVLAALHGEKLIHIVEWVPIYQTRIPSYAIGAGRNAEKPHAKTPRQRAAQRRRDPGVRFDELMQKRAARFLAKQQIVFRKET